MFTGYRTIIAAAVALASEIARVAGYDIQIGESDVNAIVTVGGLLATIAFRVFASKNLRGERD